MALSVERGSSYTILDMFAAVLDGRVGVVKVLLQYDADVNQRLTDTGATHCS